MFIFDFQMPIANAKSETPYNGLPFDRRLHAFKTTLLADGHSRGRRRSIPAFTPRCGSVCAVATVDHQLEIHERPGKANHCE